MPDTPARKPAEHAARPRSSRHADLAEAPPDPLAGVPYFVADHDLFIYNPESAALPAKAFSSGDRVPADMVAAYGWQDLTHPPEWATAPPPPPDTGPAPKTAGSEE